MCEDHCTALSSCVGYNYWLPNYYCELIPSVRSCPSGFTVSTLNPESSPIAETMNDLIAFKASKPPAQHWVCYGKNEVCLTNTDSSM